MGFISPEPSLGALFQMMPFSVLPVGGYGRFLGDRTKGFGCVQSRGTQAGGGTLSHDINDDRRSGRTSRLSDQAVPGTLAGEGSPSCRAYEKPHHPCISMLLYIVKRLGVLFWTDDGVNPLDGPSLEFGQVPFASFDLADAAGRHAQRLADLLLGDAVAHAQFAQSGATFGRRPTPGPTVAYGDERPVRLTGDEPFDAADDLEPALALAGLPGGVVPGGLVVSQADDDDAVQRHVALPVAAFIEPVPVRLATGRRDGTDAAELGERGLAPDAFGVVAGDDGQCRGDDGARAVHVEQRSRVLLEDRAHAFLQEAGLPFERPPCLGSGFRRGQRAPLDQSAGGPALGEPVHAGPAPQSPVPFPDGLRGGDEQAVDRVGDRRHRRHQLGALGVEVPQCLDPAVRAFRRAGVVAGHDAAGGGDRGDEIGLAVPAAHTALGTQHLAHLVSGGREPAGQVFMVK